jgi:hypothetical protein
VIPTTATNAKRPPPSAILPNPPWEKGKEVIDWAEHVDKDGEKNEIEQNTRIKSSQSADRLLKNRRLSPLQAVPQEKGVGKWKIENEHDDPKYARSGQFDDEEDISVRLFHTLSFLIDSC